MSKKKLIRIAKHPLCPGVYSNGMSADLAMALMSTKQDKINGKEVRYRASVFTTCRELLCSSLRALSDRKNPDIASSNASQKLEDFDFTHMRVILGTKVDNDKVATNYKRRLFAGKRALNLLENYAGWSPRTVISSVISEEDTSKSSRYWMLTGPAEWITTPQMLSLAMLILRLAMFSNEMKCGVDEINTESVEEMLDGLYEITKPGADAMYVSTRDSRFRTDSVYFNEVRNLILPILENHGKLFHKDLTKAWPLEKGWSGYGGITTYIKSGNGDKDQFGKLKTLVLNKK
jgi:hypothetical protein